MTYSYFRAIRVASVATENNIYFYFDVFCLNVPYNYYRYQINIPDLNANFNMFRVKRSRGKAADNRNATLKSAIVDSGIAMSGAVSYSPEKSEFPGSRVSRQKSRRPYIKH